MGYASPKVKKIHFLMKNQQFSAKIIWIYYFIYFVYLFFNLFLTVACGKFQIEESILDKIKPAS